MIPPAAIHRGRHLLFYVPAEEKVRLNDDSTDRDDVPAGCPRPSLTGRIRQRLGNGRPGRGHESQFDTCLQWPDGSRCPSGRRFRTRRLSLAGGQGKVVQLPMGRRIARPAADHQQHRVFRTYLSKWCQRLAPPRERERQDVGMTAQGFGLPHDEPRPRGPFAKRFGNIPSGMTGREQQQRRRHDLLAAPRSQSLERLADRGADDLEESHLDGDIREHPSDECSNLPRLLGTHRVGRSVPHDHDAPRSPALPAAGIRAPMPQLVPQPISGGLPRKQPLKRAFYEATGSTGGEEWQRGGLSESNPPRQWRRVGRRSSSI